MSSAWSGLKNNRVITELPHYAINKSLPEDSFFTDREVAWQCFDILKKVSEQHNINLDEYHFIEPSAGEGCFYDLLPQRRRTALDILPRKNYIQKADFLQWYPHNENKKYIVIGNPPFGVRGAYALAFVNRALLFADIVAFILPMSFYSNGKGTNMLRVQNATLLYNEKLKSESFYSPDTNALVSVNTVFQVWQKGTNKRIFNDYDVSEFVDIYTVCSSPARLCGLDKIGTYDCYIASTFYKNDIKIVDSFEKVKYGSGYGIIIKKQKQKVLSALRKANWIQHSSQATNHCNHIRMFSIRKCLGEQGFGRKI